MPWKIARWSLVGLACLAVLAGARADEDEKPKEKKKKEIKITLPEPYAKAAKACQECVKACAAAAKVCSEKFKEGEKQYAAPFRWMQDTSQSCQLAFVVIIRNGPSLKLVGETCAKVCDECAKACKDFEEDELTECAKQCTACAKAIRDLLRGAKPAKKDDKKAKDGEKAAFKLGAPADVTLKPGGKATVTVKLTRRNFDDEVALQVSGLPERVTVKEKEDELKVKKGADSAKFTLAAADDAKATEGHEVVVTGKSGELEARVRFKLTVKGKD